MNPRQTPKTNNLPLAFGLAIFGTLAFSFPLYAHQKNSKLVADTNGKEGLSTYQEGSLGSSGVRRGPFINSGSQDAGRDPNWDEQKGYIGKRNNQGR